MEGPDRNTPREGARPDADASGAAEAERASASGAAPSSEGPRDPAPETTSGLTPTVAPTVSSTVSPLVAAPVETSAATTEPIVPRATDGDDVDSGRVSSRASRASGSAGATSGTEGTGASDSETPPAASASRAPGPPKVRRRGVLDVWAKLSRRARAGVAVIGGAALIAAVAVPVATTSTAPPVVPAVSAAPLAASFASAAGMGIVEGGAPSTPGETATDAAPARPPVWRVAQLSDDGAVSLTEIVLARRPLLTALAGAHVSRAEAQRVVQSLEAVHSVEHFGPKDAMTLALDRASGRVVAYELAASPSQVWQGREEAEADGGLHLLAKKLDLITERVRVGRAVVVGADLRASLTEAGLAPVDDVLGMLDDALDGHAELADIRPGARLRLAATQEVVQGAFVRWLSLDAVEYFPASANAPPVRVYWFGDEDEAGEEGTPHRRHGWYDAKGRQPYHGGWRTPVPLARIASRFNPHRMHPVLHVVMPHNGVDFAAPIGSPVYATAAGVVTSVGAAGPCGNKVEVAHSGGITSVYCHLSRFAAGLHVGAHVEQRQLIAYVGQTGRVTGPHLHFGIKRNGAFIDPMSLRLDGVRVVPRATRGEFDRRRVELDAELDAVPLPATGPSPSTEPSETENFYEEPP